MIGFDQIVYPIAGSWTIIITCVVNFINTFLLFCSSPPQADRELTACHPELVLMGSLWDFGIPTLFLDSPPADGSSNNFVAED